jgi:short-subunit dehydrogenase
MSEIAGRHVLITGGASGIGRLMALELASLGARLSVWDIDAAKLGAVAAEIDARGRETAHGFVCDISRRERVYAVAAETRAAAGPIDILINNAGVVSGRALLDIPDEKIETTFAVNTLGLFWVTKAVLPDMIRANRGHVVTIASASGLIGVAKLSDYAASKWAAIGFDESLRAELHGIAPGVRTTVVCPFYINTGMFRGVKTRFPWLLPILEEDDAAHRIVAAIRRDRPRLCMPAIVSLVPAMRLLPVPLFDWLARFLGVNASMDEFTGRH